MFNGVSDQQLSFNSFGRAFTALQGMNKKPLNIPAGLIRLGTMVMQPAQGLISQQSAIHPARIAKLSRGNDIRSATLAEMNYPWAYPLDRAISDWLAKGIHRVGSPASESK